MLRPDHQEVVVDREPAIRAALRGVVVNQPVVNGIERADRCLEDRGFNQIKMLQLDSWPIDDGERNACRRCLCPQQLKSHLFLLAKSVEHFEVLDRLSQQEQMRLKLLRAETPPARISLSIVDGPRIKLKHFDLVETAVLETPVGALNTVHYRLIHDDPSERSSDSWLAVDHDFLMVRTEHVEKGSETVIQLEGATIAGQAVSGR